MYKLPFYNQFQENPMTRRKARGYHDISGYSQEDMDRIMAQEAYKVLGPYGEYPQSILGPDLLSGIEKEKLESQAEQYIAKQRKKKKAIKKMTFDAAKNIAIREAEAKKARQKKKAKNRTFLRPKEQRKFEDDVRKYFAELGRPLTIKKKKIIIEKIRESADQLAKFGEDININQDLQQKDYEDKLRDEIEKKETDKILNEFNFYLRVPNKDIIENEIIMDRPSKPSYDNPILPTVDTVDDILEEELFKLRHHNEGPLRQPQYGFYEENEKPERKRSDISEELEDVLNEIERKSQDRLEREREQEILVKPPKLISQMNEDEFQDWEDDNAEANALMEQAEKQFYNQKPSTAEIIPDIIERETQQVLHEYGPTPHEWADYYQSGPEAVDQIYEESIDNVDRDRINKLRQDTLDNLETVMIETTDNAHRDLAEKLLQQNNNLELDLERRLDDQRLANSVLDLEDEYSLSHELRQVGEYLEPSGEFHQGPISLEELRNREVTGFRHPRALSEYESQPVLHEYGPTPIQQVEYYQPEAEPAREYFPSRNELNRAIHLIDEGIKDIETEDFSTFDSTIDELKEFNRKYREKKALEGKGIKKRIIRRKRK